MATQSSESNVPEIKDSLRRLLLCEVLIEEYESLGQPALNGAELTRIKGEIKDHHQKYESLSDEERADAEEELNGRLVKEIYARMIDAQRREADQQAQQDSDKYRQLYSNPYTSLPPEDLEKIVDRAVIAQIYGHVDELNDKYNRQYISETDKAKRNEMAKKSTLKALHDEA